MNSYEFWIAVGAIAGSLLFLKMLFSGINTAIKLTHENRQFWGKNQHGVPPMFQKLADQAMAERDAEIASLQDRVEVLEKIVTDQHNQSKAKELADEIDKLNS